MHEDGPVIEVYPALCTQVTERFGYEPLEVRRYNYSGGTVAVVARRVGKRMTEAPPKGMDNSTGAFDSLVRNYASKLTDTLTGYRAAGGEVVIYGTGCRACTMINGLGLGELIDYAVDDQKERQGLFISGARLPIYAPERMVQDPRMRLVILAVNQENEAKVTSTIKNEIQGDAEVLSPFCPNEIYGELEALRARLKL